MAGSDQVPPNSGDITRLLAAISGGDRTALNQLFPVVYTELRALAHRQLVRLRPVGAARAQLPQPGALRRPLELYTTETWEGTRIQTFVNKGLAPVTTLHQGTVWPTAAR